APSTRSLSPARTGEALGPYVSLAGATLTSQLRFPARLYEATTPLLKATQTFLPSVAGVGRAYSLVSLGSGPSALRSAFQRSFPSARFTQEIVPGSEVTRTRSPAIKGLEVPGPTFACHLTFFLSLHSVGGVASGYCP